MRVIDISMYQGSPDFAKVRLSGVEGVILKATEGRTYRDPRYAENVQRARAAGLLIGHYHFGRPDLNGDPVWELGNFTAVAQIRSADWIVLDLEAAVTGTVGQWALAWLKTAAHRWQRRPILYSYVPWIKAHIPPGLTELAATASLWVAAYTSTPPTPPAPWYAFGAWQYTSSGSVPGITGRVDLNHWHIPPHTSEEDDMFTDADRAKLDRINQVLTFGGDADPNLGDVVNEIVRQTLEGIPAGVVDPKVLAAELAAELARRLVA